MKKLSAIVVLLSLLVSCTSEKENEGTTQKTEDIVSVKTSRSVKEVCTQNLELSGTVFASREANVGSSIPGKVEEICVKPGQRVKKGDLLVRMSGELYTQAMVEYKTIEKDFERVSRLRDKGSITEQDYDHVKAKYDASRSNVEMLKKNAEIRAPFSGTVIDFLVEEGENYFFNINMEPGYSHTSGILRLMCLQPLDVVVEVNEKDLPKIKTGKKAFISLTALPDTLLEGRVSSVDPVLSTRTHTAKVHIRLNNLSGMIKPGMFADVKIVLGEDEYILIPGSALYRQAGTGDNYVYEVSGDRVKRHKIERILTTGDRIAVTGIPEGMELVTQGKNKLSNESKVKVMN